MRPRRPSCCLVVVADSNDLCRRQWEESLRFFECLISSVHLIFVFFVHSYFRATLDANRVAETQEPDAVIEDGRVRNMLALSLVVSLAPRTWCCHHGRLVPLAGARAQRGRSGGI